MTEDWRDTRDRVIRLEEQVDHLEAKIEEMAKKVTEMHGLLMQAKGMRWMVLALIAVSGFLAGKLGWLVSFVSASRP